MERFRSAVRVVLINLLMIFALLYLIEFFFSPYRGLPVNGVTADGLYTWGHRVENNRYGLREREFAEPKPAGLHRVMVLGDSLTWGAGLAVEQRYTAVAERLLNADAGHEGPRFEVLNFGVSGGPTVLERDILRMMVDRVEPDLVVVGFCLNDPQPRSQDYSVERERLDGETATRLVRALATGLTEVGLRHLGKLMVDAYYRSAERAGTIPDWRTALDRVYQRSSDEWRGFVGALEEIKAISDARALSAPLFAVLNQGVYTDRPTDYRRPDESLRQYLGWYRQAERAAAESGFVAYNHQAEIAERLSGEVLAVNAVDGHPSAELNRLYGEKLAIMVRRQLTER